MGSWVREADSRQPPRIPQEVPLGGTDYRLPLRDDTILTQNKMPQTQPFRTF